MLPCLLEVSIGEFQDRGVSGQEFQDRSFREFQGSFRTDEVTPHD
jgi:hypothetical protein